MTAGQKIIDGLHEAIAHARGEDTDVRVHRIPAEVFHPGVFLREELEARGWTQGEFAGIVGRPRQAINQIITGKRGITTRTAREFAAAFDTSPQYWLNLWDAYRLSKVTP